MCNSSVSAVPQYPEGPSLLRVAGIVQDSITDGPGLRFAVFLQGCPRRCDGCHNPEALPFGEGGVVMSVDELCVKLRKNPLARGVTLSGGEPFCQAEALSDFAARVKADGYELSIYTGYKWEELLNSGDFYVKSLLESADTLLDGEFVLARRNLNLKFKGSENQRILNVQKSLDAGSAVLEESDRWN